MPVRRGIITSFAGVTFRSRLEATWAHLFTALKWKWDYEPVDLDGYLPDFDLGFRKRPLLTEIKPLDEDIRAAKRKILNGGWTGDAAILISGADKFIGEIYEAEGGWDRAILTFCLACKSPTIVSEGGRWSCRSCNGSSRDLWWAYDAASEWRGAKNATRWKPRAA